MRAYRHKASHVHAQLTPREQRSSAVVSAGSYPCLMPLYNGARFTERVAIRWTSSNDEWQCPRSYWKVWRLSRIRCSTDRKVTCARNRPAACAVRARGSVKVFMRTAHGWKRKQRASALSPFLLTFAAQCGPHQMRDPIVSRRSLYFPFYSQLYNTQLHL